MKMPVSWHQECLRNMKCTLQHDEQRLIDLQQHVAQRRVRIHTLQDQIDRAIAEGKGSFDEDRFNVKREPPCTP